MHFRKDIVRAAIAVGFFWVIAAGPLAAQSRGLRAIRAADMKVHMEFLASPIFEGRPAPSTAVEIASLYLAQQAKLRGLKPILPDGSFFQPVPIEVTTVSQAKSRLRILSEGGEQVLYFPQSFAPYSLRGTAEGALSGRVVFVGTTRDADEKTLEGLDLKGAMAVAIALPVPEGPRPAAGSPPPFFLTRYLREKGAAGLVTIITNERERYFRDNGRGFDIAERLAYPSIDQSGRSGSSMPAAAVSFVQLEVRHAAGAAILGLASAEMEARIAAAMRGERAAPGAVDGRILEASIYFDKRMASASNVVGVIEGSDPKLKSEYITITGHQDHLSMREGRVYPGADDNASAAVAMLEIIEALVIERPKRSVIMVWGTAEERGLVGAYHFVQHCPVPVENISANINLDMLARNDPNMVYFVGSNCLSTEFDQILRAAMKRSAGMRVDDAFQNPAHPDRFFFRSDQFPHIQYGIPGVWIFCGTTEDYHTPNDLLERVDYAKMEKLAKFTYTACLDVGNAPGMMKLDVRPDVTTRGAHNMAVNWRR
ncbi:MAG: M20/M25/M40 family metallo-hydrolase [Candidatus Aminicenantes bacterium]|nr:M20/M25/M40 family metallo-hydrolase [Candidatus Aminicenantes bacterium]